MKRKLIFVFFIGFVFSIFGLSNVYADAPISCFEVDSSNNAKITNYKCGNKYDIIKIPATINGTKITTIGSNAFDGVISSELYIPEGVTTIETGAFKKALFVFVDVPSSLTTADFTLDQKYWESYDLYEVTWYLLDSNYNRVGVYTFEPGKKATIGADGVILPEIYDVKASSVSYNKIKIRWESDADYDAIQIYKYNPKSKKYEYYTYTTAHISVNLSKGLKTGTTYYYKIRAYVKSPTTGKKYYTKLSKVIAVKPIPSTPTKVKATKYRSGVAKITWKKVTGASGYAVFKYNTKNKQYYYIKSTTKLSTTTSYNLKKGSGTYYRVKAYKMVNGKRVYSKYSAATYTRV